MERPHDDGDPIGWLEAVDGTDTSSEPHARHGNSSDPHAPHEGPGGFLTTDVAHDPFPCLGNHGGHHESLPPQVLVETGKGGSSAIVLDVEGKNDDGSLTVMGVGHAVTKVGSIVHAWLPGADGSHATEAEARVVFIHGEHDRFFARIDPETAEAWRQNFNVDMVLHTRVRAGEEVAFTQQAGVHMPVLRHGVVGGAGDKTGGLVTLSGTEGTLGSSGAPVFDREGHLVGQVVAYDPKNHLNLMSSAEQILGDIHDFRHCKNMAERAHPVSYGGAVAPVIRRGL